MTTAWDLTSAVLVGVASGATNKALARVLIVDEKTVEYHVTKLLARLEVPNRTALVGKAYATGLVTDWPPRIDVGKWQKFTEMNAEKGQQR